MSQACLIAHDWAGRLCSSCRFIQPRLLSSARARRARIWHRDWLPKAATWVLFDPKGAWEKPCGGGVPTRAIREFAFLLESSNYPSKLVRRITMISPLERSVTLTLDEPFAVFSRQVLNSLVLDRAIQAGAEFVREGVTDFPESRMAG